MWRQLAILYPLPLDEIGVLMLDAGAAGICLFADSGRGCGSSAAGAVDVAAKVESVELVVVNGCELGVRAQGVRLRVTRIRE